MRREELRTRDFVLSGLLLAMGFVLHALFPGILGGMKPDFALIMLFLVLMLFEDPRVVFTAGMVTGLLTALTTSFPAGQIPNMVDKLVTTIFIFTVLKRLPQKLMVPIIGIFGTLVSGTTFLLTALLFTGLPAGFLSLMGAVVVPAMLINTIGLVVLYPIVFKLYELQEKQRMSFVDPPTK